MSSPSPETALAIAQSIRKNYVSEEKFAFLLDGEQVYFSRGSRPILTLIQAIWDDRPDQARKILRRRIFSTTPITISEQGMIKVAAKRASTLSLGQTHPPEHAEFRIQELKVRTDPAFLELSDIPRKIQKLIQERLFAEAADELSKQVLRGDQLFSSDRPVAAILVSHDGRFLGAAKNTNAKNRTRHAEVNLIQGYLSRSGLAKIPSQTSLYVSLKCCKMCAGMIWDFFENPLGLTVFYSEVDLGPHARATVLDAHSEARKAATQEASAEDLARVHAPILQFKPIR